MTSAAKSPSTILREYADILAGYAAATTEKELDEIADDLMIVEGEMQEHGKEIAQLIHNLLGQNAKAVAN